MRAGGQNEHRVDAGLAHDLDRLPCSCQVENARSNRNQHFVSKSCHIDGIGTGVRCRVDDYELDAILHALIERSLEPGRLHVRDDRRLTASSSGPYPRRLLRIRVDDLDSDPASMRLDGKMDDQRRFPRPAFLGHDSQRLHTPYFI